MPLLKIDNDSLMLAAGVISRGGLAAFPTETVYGLGGDAYNPAALAAIFEAKGRPRFDPLIVHIAAFETLEIIADLSLLDTSRRKRLELLAERFWPGPLTLVLPKGEAVPSLATGGLSTVAVRIPAHEAALRLISLSTGAVAAPSANPFGYLSPTRAEHVLESLGDKVEIILNGGPAKLGVESTVLDISGAAPRLLRPGGVPIEAIEEITGPISAGTAVLDAAEGLPSPGLLKSHYAPAVPLETHGTVICNNPAADEAFLFFDGASRGRWLSSAAAAVTAAGQQPPERFPVTRVLSETGDMLEAAARLFDVLHELDRLPVKLIHAQLAPPAGLGAAINDRLTRASCRRTVS